VRAVLLGPHGCAVALDVTSITWMALVVGLIAAPMPTMADGYM